MQRNHFAIALLSGVSSLALATAAIAADTQSAEAPVEEIIVTGSRVVTNGAQAPTPLTVVSVEQLQDSSPSSIVDALEKLPQFSGSQGPLNASAGGNIGTSGPTQGNFINLRGLGTTRLLILLDGQRVPPTSYDGSIDLDTLPQSLVSRVDIVTGGASAAYGSDAITGVVNYVLDKKFEGVKASVQGGLSNYGDDGSQRYTLTVGHQFERAHIEASFEHYGSSGIYSDNERPLGVSNGTARNGTGTAANPYYSTVGLFQVNNSWQGMIRSGSLINYIWNDDGSIRKIDPGLQNTGTGTTYGYGASVGETYDGGVTKTLVAPQNTNQAFGRISFEATPDLTLYAQGVFGGSDSHFKAMPSENNAPGAAQISIFPDNAYLTPATRTQIFGANPAPTASVLFGRFSRDLPPYTSNLKTRAWHASIGADGQIGTWGYNINYTHARSTLLAFQNDILLTHYAAELDAVVDPKTGNIVCYASLTQYASLYQGCVPLNLFGQDPNRRGAPTPQSISFLYNPLFYFDVVNQMDIIDASAHGDLWDMPAGTMKAAVGIEYRHQSMNEVTDGAPSQLTQDLGLRAINPVSNPTIYAQDAAANATGSLHVKEAFGEISIPLIKNQVILQALDLDLAGRITDYSTSGTVETWKIGVTDSVTDDLRLRGTMSRDIRAPSLYQLFQQPSQTIGGFQDPLTGLQQSLLTTNGGNRNLVPETGTTFSAGFVYQPEFIPGLAMTVDYFKIKMSNAIGTESTMQEVLDCNASGGTAPICSAIHRPINSTSTAAGNFPTSIDVQLQNFSYLSESGLDVELDYKVPVEVFGGDLSFRILANGLFHYLSQTAPSAALVDYADYMNGSAQLAKAKGSISANYRNGPLSATLTNRFTGSVKQSPINFYLKGDSRLPNYVYTDLNINYEIPHDNWTAVTFVSINNLMDTQPPFRAQTQNPDFTFPTVRSVYDVVGRYFTVGVRFRYK